MSAVELTRGEFAQFQQFIYKTTGIRMPEMKRTLLSSRIRRRVKAGGFDGFQSYYRHLTSLNGREELDRFLDVVTTNETYFFRTGAHFEWFRSQFLPDMIAQARRGQRPRSLRIWSAACSTGEEAYTLAMCLADNMLQLKDWKLSVVGTDVSAEVLQRARRGVYKQRSIEGVDDRRLRRYFTKVPGEPLWQVRQNLKDLVEFQQHNLIQPLECEPFDCIFLRNVLIYFDQESKRIVLDNLVLSMADDAYLVIGPSEGVYDLLGDLKRHSTFLYQKTRA